MNTGILHRLVILLGFLASLATFAFNYNSSGDLLYSAFWSLCVLLGVSIVMLAALQSVASILLKHLQERQHIQREAQEEQARKQSPKQQQP